VSIGLRLARAFVLVAFIIVLGAGVTVWQFDTVVSKNKNILAIDDRIATTDRLELDITTLQRQLTEIVDRQDAKALIEATDATRPELFQHLRQAESAFHESGELTPATLRASMASMEDELDALNGLARLKDWLALRLRVKVQLVQVMGEIATVVDEIRASVVRARATAVDEIQARYSSAKLILGLTGACSLLASLLLGVQVTRSITRPLYQIQRAAHQLASANFRISLQIGSNDELAEVGRDVAAAARQLETSYQALTRSNENLQSFASTVSHDLREPLRTITIFAQLLKRDSLSVLTDRAKECIDAINEASIQMGHLIDGILEYSRTASTEDLKVEELLLQDIVNTATSNLHAAIEETAAVVSCGALPCVWGNRVRMVQLFQNLIGNAIKYRRDEVPPRVDITARHRAGEWVLSAKDNGIGIDPRHQDFKQLDRRKGGIGLGLSVSKRIVEQHGGAIWIESDGRSGSTFNFSIPDCALISAQR
jgi:signal transduction histidine kinase